MKSANLLYQLNLKIAQLADAITPVAAQRTRQARFDSQLFHCHSTRLGDYLVELQRNHQQLLQSVRDNHTEQVRWLAERIVTQMEALQRELATVSMRKSETNNVPNGKTVYEKLAEHQEFERRLSGMIADREGLLRQQDSLSQQRKSQQEIAVLEGRLQRCRQALKRIERDIERGER